MTSAERAARGALKALRTRTSLVAAVLAGQNAVVFLAHYVRGAGFPWDFAMSYYAMVAFWTTGVRLGTIPSWIPFQQMGYPFALQMQSGMNYLPLWIFPVFGVPYTLHAAIVFQCLHVLAGSLGMFALARQIHHSWKYALIAAVAFQFFGGFYTNAEHVDIVRAFALTPWLLFVFTIDLRPRARLRGRTIAIPVVVYLFATGGYPGNVFAGSLILGLYVALQIVGGYSDGARVPHLLRVGFCVAALSLIGAGMAITQYGPVWLHRAEFVRAGVMSTVPHHGLWIDHLPGLFLSSRTLPGEVSMASTYVTLPMVVFACFIPFRTLRKAGALLGIGMLATLMTAGERSPVWTTLTGLVPTLALSRFPSSDYRAFVAIAVILLGVGGLRAIAAHKLSTTSIVLRSVFCAGWAAWGIASVHGVANREGLLAAMIAVASLSTIMVAGRVRPGPTVLVLACLVLVGLDGWRVLPDLPGWHEPDMDAYYIKQNWPPYSAGAHHRLIVSRIFEYRPTRRPARIVPERLVRWNGYLDGSYVTTDLTPNVLQAAGRVNVNKLYEQYMRMEWRPLLLDVGEFHAARQRAEASDDVLKRRIGSAQSFEAAPAGEGTVEQTRYGVNDITYRVSLRRPQLMVENEMYFPGWRATLSDGQQLDAFEANGVFRAWLLPAGTYTMTARFAFPAMRFMASVAAASVLLWLGAVVLWRRGVPATVAVAQARASEVLEAWSSRGAALAGRHPGAVAFICLALLLVYAGRSAANLPQYGDAAGYWSVAQTFETAGRFSLVGYSEPLRGYSFPLLLYAIQRVARAIGVDGLSLFRFVSALTGSALLALVFPAFFRRTLNARPTLVSVAVFCFIGAIFWRGHLLYSLSDFPALLALVAGLVLLHRTAGAEAGVIAALGAGACLAWATNARPINGIALLGGLGMICWLGWHRRRTAVATTVLPFLVGAMIVLGPQSIINARVLGSWSPFANGRAAPGQPSLYTQQLEWGVAIQRYETNVGASNGFPAAVMFPDTKGSALIKLRNRTIDPRVFAAAHPLDTLDYLGLVAHHPGYFAGAYARHLFNGLDVASPEPYLEQVLPRRGFFALANYMLLTVAAIYGISRLARRRPRVDGSRLAILAIFALPALMAIPTAIEPRFLLPLWMLAAGIVAFRVIPERAAIPRPYWIISATVGITVISGCFALATATYSNILGPPHASTIWCWSQCTPVGVSARLQIDAPAPGAAIQCPFMVGGWALDPKSAIGTGIDGVQVWAYPVPRVGIPAFLGEASYGGARPDVGAAFGEPLRNSGFGLVVQSLTPGTYDLTVFARMTSTGDFAPPTVVRVTVR